MGRDLKEGWYWVLPNELEAPIPCYYLPDYDGFIIGGIENAEYLADIIEVDYYDHEIKWVGDEIKEPESSLNWSENEKCVKVRSFLSPFEDEMIYLIKGGHKDTYIVVHDDAHNMTLGQTNVLSAEGVKNRYGIEVWV